MNYLSECFPLKWQNNTPIPYLGCAIQLQLEKNTLGHNYIGNYDAPQSNDRLILSTRHSALNPNKTQVKELVKEWFQGRALVWFNNRLKFYYEKCLLRPKKLALSSALGSWGSCNSKQTIRLNWRLMHLAPDLIDYVIVHELAHLKQMNHSPLFWHEVEKIMPTYKEKKAQLKQIHMSFLT